MGVNGLLNFVKNACRQGNIVEFKGKSIAVDVSCLLHKGVFGCMESFADGQDTKMYINYVKKHVQYLLDMQCHVVLVFDGSALPAKKNINDQRRQRRMENMRAGSVLLSQGKREEAVAKFQQATAITRDIVESTIEFFRKMPMVDVVVAPYEADAQLAFLMKNDFVDIVITEDSDLIVFGCEKIVFKWAVESGSCTVFENAKLSSCFTGDMANMFDFDKFRRICILSGCDYLQDGLPGVGLNKAYTFFSKTSQKDLRKILPRIPSYLKMPKLKISNQFIEEFIRAEKTFLHQIVFDPRSRCQRPLNPYSFDTKEIEKKVTLDDEDDFLVKTTDKTESLEKYDFAGTVASALNAVRAALGNQAENQSMLDKFLLPQHLPDWSVWSSSYKSRGVVMKEIEKKEKEKKQSCGVFKLDSPNKMKRKMDSSDGLKTEPSKTTKKLKNSADDSWSYESMMALYGQEADVKTNSSSFATSLSNIGDDDDIIIEKVQNKTNVNEKKQENKENKASNQGNDKDCKAETVETNDQMEKRKELGDAKGDRKDDIDLVIIEEKKSNPENPNHNICVNSVANKKEREQEKVKSAPPTQPARASAYFKRRLSSCSNPFKKPKIDPAFATQQNVTENNLKPSILERDLENKENENESSTGTKLNCSYLLTRSVGFRAPGLRKSYSN